MNTRTTPLVPIAAIAVLLGLAACSAAPMTAGTASAQADPSTTATGAASASSASSPDPAPSAATADPATGTSAGVAQVSAVLAALPVKGRAPSTGYARTDDFGTAWLDVDHNGCDTRNDVLARDLTDVVRSGPCTVLTGHLVSPYTDQPIAFVRGQTTSTLVQIDHLVALEEAWETGAQQLTQTDREALANDPLNLLAVDQHSNEQKGAGDAATWLPAATGFRCAYVARQVVVKAEYALWVTPAEHDAIARILAGCTDTAVAMSGLSVAALGPDLAGGTVSYANCDAVRAAGAAPIHVGDPGYSRQLDRDGDGTGCE